MDGDEVGTQRPRPRGWFCGGRTDVCLPRRLDRKWASERENVCGVSEGEAVWGVLGSRTASASPAEEGKDACPHRYILKKQ